MLQGRRSKSQTEAVAGTMTSVVLRNDGLHGRCAPGHPTASEDLLRTDEDACCHGHLGRIHRCRGTEKAAVRADRVNLLVPHASLMLLTLYLRNGLQGNFFTYTTIFS